LQELTRSQIAETIETDLAAPIYLTQAALGALKRNAPADVVNIASIAGLQGFPEGTAYCAAKHGVVGLTRSLAEELRDEGIAVNAICPGSVDTEMLQVGMPGGKPRMSAEEVARVALFLAADAPLAMTGSCVDGVG